MFGEARAVLGETHGEPVRRPPHRWPESTPVPPIARRSIATVAADIRIEPRTRAQRVSKRAIDVVGSVLGLVLLSPIFVVVSVLVRATSRGPAFFVQERCGEGGRVFRFYKFRTMVKDAQARRAELEHLNEMNGPAFKIARDPRITSVGAFLRKTSLDELPQLLNVLKGEMSLVGPRPPLPEEVACYDKRQAQRLSVQPGLTGLWQVSGRNSIRDFDKWLELDLEYARRWSVWLDLRILSKTVFVVLSMRGAH